MRRRAAAVVVPVAVLAALVGAWQLYVVITGVSPLLLPRPAAVWDALVDLIGEGATMHHAWVTLQEIVGGFAIAAVSGLVVGIVLGRNPPAERALNPVIVALQVVPKVALIPLLSLWLGYGISGRIVVAAIFGFLPILAGAVAGVRAVDPNHRDLLRSLRARPSARVRFLELPSALPAVLTGMEVGIVLATVGALVAEYLGGDAGLGYLAVRALNGLDVARLFAVIVVMCVVGFCLYVAVAALRRLLVPWHPSAWRDLHDHAPFGA